ncbi:Gfo/Idh/MocA family protein [Nocardioides albus]|uniref:Putative dehydrogenase n=1 Tax=Nocardioides albus TaxID=1841 RepID=A0A7W5A608_9ACTN|nr:Gfo/Idh/MocA family oxidoreductase [Nocardioides albus]MBB3090050.1 putative dehydrogenase [Nocardioides albus]GGU27326.1 oxidoreductase [Nocardioides albus]
MTEQKATLGVGMIGYAFMGAVHSHAWRSAHRFFDLPLTPRMQVVCGRDATRVAEAATRFGWEDSATDWRDVIARDDVDLVDVCTPGDTHAEIAIAALEAGKHVLCEKPLANSVAEAERMAAAAAVAAERGVRTMVGFTYRRVPAIALARKLVADGRLGELHHVRAQYLQDWLADPEAPLSWRLDKSKAGSGALGDIGAHVIDLTQHITGDRIQEVSGMLETFVKERPVAEDSSGLSATAGADRGPVTVDDTALFLARFAGGAVGSFEATRFATGRKNAIRIEINGSKGSLAFDFEDMNVLHFHDATLPDTEGGFRRIVVTEPEHPWVGGWWPPGHGLGYEHGFTHQVVDLVQALGAGTDPAPTFADGLQVQRVLAAVETSSDTRTWQEIPV